jgi:vancomycin resistance protein YoaR
MIKLVKKLKTIFFFIVFCLALIYIPFVNKIYPNIYVSNIYIGDKTKDQALSTLKEKVILPQKIILTSNGQNFEILTSEIETKIDFDKSIQRAYFYANSGDLFKDFVTKLNLIFKPTNLGLSISLNENEINESLHILSNKIAKKPIQPSVTIISGKLDVFAGKNGTEIDTKQVRENIGKNLSFQINSPIELHILERKTKLEPDELSFYKSRAEKILGKKIELRLLLSNNLNDFELLNLADFKLVDFIDPYSNGFLTELINQEALEVSKKLNRTPQDSVFIVEEGKIVEFKPSKSGVVVDQEKLVLAISNALLSLLESDQKIIQVEIPVTKLDPKIKTSDVNNLGIRELIGKGVSYYKGSIPNRIYNINHASNKFKGILVPPNETFSFNSVLGDVSALTGYKAAYVIKDGKTVLGDGGGVCQVSTTLFRAVLNAGLPIIERRAHSYRVGYYEQGFSPGLDATIFYPTTDFKFKNNTPGHILIQPINNQSASTLIFEIYGTNDGRVATITRPIVTSSIAPPPDLYLDDPTLPTGTVKQIEHKAWGARVVFDYKVERNGEELINQKFVSSYRPWQAVYLRGTGVVH